MLVYVPSIDDEIIPRWMGRINGLGMRCEIYPGFSFKSHTGFLPFRVILETAAHAKFQGTDYLTGYEFYASDFKLERELETINPKPGLFGKLFGKKRKPNCYVSQEIDRRLASCNKVLHFNWGSADTLELRMATLSSAILAEITNGVCCYPADTIWYSNERIVENTLKEVEEYEASLGTEEWKLHRFEKWL